MPITIWVITSAKTQLVSFLGAEKLGRILLFRNNTNADIKTAHEKNDVDDHGSPHL